MKNNNLGNSFEKIYLLGFYIILALPVFVLPPFFSPPDWGKSIIFRSIIAIMLCLFAWQFFYRRNEIIVPNIKKNKIILVLVAFFFAVLLSTLFSQDICFSLLGSPYRAEGAINFLLYILFPILAFFVVKPSNWNKFLKFSIFIGILVCLIALIQFYGLFSNVFFTIDSRPPSTMGNPIMLGIYLIILSFITLTLAIKEQKISYKIFYGASLLLFLIVTLITGSRAAYLGLIFGTVYFFLFYPIKNKKIFLTKIVFTFLLIVGFFSIWYINSQKTFPQLLEKNKIFQSVKSRLSLNMALEDPRFSAWQIIIQEIKEKPIFGWGPENLAIGFDKYYDPALPFISKEWGGWWDRAHNIILDTTATMGIFATILYLSLFIILFWQLQKYKNKQPIIYHGIQATLIAYFTANFFSFDGFSTYLLFYLIIGYSLHLTSADPLIEEPKNNFQKIKGANSIMAILLILLIIFLWQYNFVPLKINAAINKADNYAGSRKCNQYFLLADKIVTQGSFLDAYMTMHYIEAIQKCIEVNPTKNLEYAKKGITVMEKAVKVRPLYSRLWIFLGSFKNIEANAEQDPVKKLAQINEANFYFEKAKQLAPKHQEILVEQAKTDMIVNDYQAMKEKSEKCISLYKDLGDCYWIRALSEIYSKNVEQAQKYILLANEKRFNTSAVSSMYQLVNAYANIKDYKNLIATYNQLIKINTNVAEYHSSIAFAYSQIGEYKKAREEAMIFLKLLPTAENEVNLFLKTLPY